MKTAIIIPARYGSTRLPGKPLVLIAGQTMLSRVAKIAKAAAGNDTDIRCFVATDDERIGRHADEIGIPWVMTSVKCRTGTDRAEEAVRQLDFLPDFVVNLQGDAPLTPPDFIRAMIDAYAADPCDLVTPVTQMSWEQLDRLRDSKKMTPFSGTTALFDSQTGRAFWFSKNIIPALRQEKDLRDKGPVSPVWRHIGLYGYSRPMLAKFGSLPESTYERVEGLEQLRILENGYTIRCVPVDYNGRANISGVDSPEDIARTEALIVQHGELVR